MQTRAELLRAIQKLPARTPLFPRSQKENWIAWLLGYDEFPRKNPDRNAQVVYNALNNANYVIWLGAAAGVDPRTQDRPRSCRRTREDDVSDRAALQSLAADRAQGRGDGAVGEGCDRGLSEGMPEVSRPERRPACCLTTGDFPCRSGRSSPRGRDFDRTIFGSPSS
jgi:hypothetical protein